MYKGRYIYPAFPFLPSFNYMNIWKGISSKQAYGVFPFLIFRKELDIHAENCVIFSSISLSLSLSPSIHRSTDIQSCQGGGRWTWKKRKPFSCLPVIEAMDENSWEKRLIVATYLKRNRNYANPFSYLFSFYTYLSIPFPSNSAIQVRYNSQFLPHKFHISPLFKRGPFCFPKGALVSPYMQIWTIPTCVTLRSWILHFPRLKMDIGEGKGGGGAGAGKGFEDGFTPLPPLSFALKRKRDSGPIFWGPYALRANLGTSYIKLRQGKMGSLISRNGAVTEILLPDLYLHPPPPSGVSYLKRERADASCTLYENFPSDCSSEDNHEWNDFPSANSPSL